MIFIFLWADRFQAWRVSAAFEGLEILGPNWKRSASKAISQRSSLAKAKRPSGDLHAAIAQRDAAELPGVLAVSPTKASNGCNSRAASKAKPASCF